MSKQNKQPVQATLDKGNVVEVYRQHSGRVLYYPSNDLAKLIVNDLLGKKCLDGKLIPVVKQLGFRVFTVPNPETQSTVEL